MADHPIDECLKTAAPYIRQGHTIYQKWTCRHCGARQTMDQPNKFFRSGRCGECGKVTIIQQCNYLLHAKLRR